MEAMLTHDSGYWLGISNDLLRESRRLSARAKRIEEDERIGGGDHRQGEVEWLKARADEACKLGTEVYEALRVAADDYGYSSEWDHGANFPPDEAVIDWWRFQGLQWCSVHWAGTPYANRLVGVTSDDDGESESEDEDEDEC